MSKIQYEHDFSAKSNTCAPEYMTAYHHGSVNIFSEETVSDWHVECFKDRNRNNFPIWEQMSLRGFGVGQAVRAIPCRAMRLLRRRLLAMTRLGKLFRLRS